MVGKTFHLYIFISVLIYTSYAASIKDDTISTDETRTKFLLWTRQNPSGTQELLFEDLSSVVNSNFNSTLKTKVLVHGYTGSGTQSWVTHMKDSFLLKGEKNITGHSMLRRF